MLTDTSYEFVYSGVIYMSSYELTKAIGCTKSKAAIIYNVSCITHISHFFLSPSEYMDTKPV